MPVKNCIHIENKGGATICAVHTVNSNLNLFGYVSYEKAFHPCADILFETDRLQFRRKTADLIPFESLTFYQTAFLQSETANILYFTAYFAWKYVLKENRDVFRRYVCQPLK